MKKIMFAVMAMCALGFTACGNKAQTAEAPADEVEAVVYNAEEEAAASINQLTEQIEAQDASKFQEVLAAIQEKIKDIIGSDPADSSGCIDRCSCRDRCGWSDAGPQWCKGCCRWRC